MKAPNIKQSILTKVVDQVSNPIVVAENLSPEGTRFILCDRIYEVYSRAIRLAEFKFKEQHQKYLAITDSELESIRQDLQFFNISLDEHMETAVDRLVNDNLRSADEIIQMAGVRAVVIADNKLQAVRKVLMLYPIYAITCDHYLSIRGGKQILEQVLAKTKAEFKGLVPGQFKFNHRKNKREKGTEVPTPVKENEKASNEIYDDFFL